MCRELIPDQALNLLPLKLNFSVCRIVRNEFLGFYTLHSLGDCSVAIKMDNDVHIFYIYHLKSNKYINTFKLGYYYH